MTRLNLLKAYPFFLSAIIALLYANSLSFGFIDFWDNQGFSYIKNNPLITNFSAENIKTIFTSSFDHHYHPLSLLSLAIDYHLGGTNPLVYRITNLLLFYLVSLFLFIFVKRLTKNFYLAAFVSLAYAIHPFNIESVLWLSERKNLLFAFFWFPSVIFYLQYLRSKKYYFLIFSALLFFLSLLSKSQGLTLLPVLFLIDYLEKKPFNLTSVLNKTPFILLAVVFSIIAYAFHDPEIFVRTHPAAFTDYLFTGFKNIVFYITRSFIPFGFSPYYPYPEANSLMPVFWYYPMILLTGIFFVYRYFRHDRLMLFGLGFYAVTIFPMLKCFPIPYGNFISADRYMILPLVGLVIVLWSLVSKLPFVKKTVGGIAVALFSALLFFTSFHYSLTWKDSLSFYSGLIEKHPELRSAWGNRGRVYMAQEKFPEAIADYTELIHLDPGYSNAYLNRGLAYIRVNKDYNAFNDFSSAIQYDSGNYKAYNNRALLLLKQKQPEKALEDALKAVDIGYQDPDTWFNAALIYLSLEKYDDCLKSLDNAAKFNFRNKQLIEKMRAEAISKKTSTSGS